MIKFFNRIRKSVITDKSSQSSPGKITRYMFYAVGEIILVVIGILLALAINNWTQEKKERVLETKILDEIRSNLKLDLTEIQSDIYLLNLVDSASERILHHINNESEPSEAFYKDIPLLAVTPHFDPNKSGYALLTSNGVEIILNDSLRRAISAIYELSYPYYNKYEQERIQLKTHHTDQFFLDYFQWVIRPELTFESSCYISLKDYVKIRGDGSFNKLVSGVKYANYLILDRAMRTEKKIQNLIDLIQEEIGD